MMDLQEAKACLDEHRIALANICGMLKPVVAEGELGEVLGKLNQKLIEKLNDQEKDAIILSNIILEELKETREQLLDCPGELADFFVALNQLRLGINKAAEARAEYLRQAAASNLSAERIERAHPIRDAIIEWERNWAIQQAENEEYRRRNGLMSKEEIEEYDLRYRPKSPAHLVETLNTPDRIDPAETDAPGNEAGTEIGMEPFESPSPSAIKPGEECGTPANCTDETEDLLNRVAGPNRAGVIAGLSEQAETVQLSVERFASQPAKLREAMARLDWVNRILSYFRDGNIAPGMSEHELRLCQAFEEKIPVWGRSYRVHRRGTDLVPAIRQRKQGKRLGS